MEKFSKKKQRIKNFLVASIRYQLVCSILNAQEIATLLMTCHIVAHKDPSTLSQPIFPAALSITQYYIAPIARAS